METRDTSERAPVPEERLRLVLADAPEGTWAIGVAVDLLTAVADEMARQRESYDALVSNSSAEHQRMSDLCQALSTNVIRLDEQRTQDDDTIEYWKGQFTYASERVAALEERLRGSDAAASRRLSHLVDQTLGRLRTMFGLPHDLDIEGVFLAVERYDASNLRTIDSLRDHVAMHAKLGQLAHKQAERWQEMAEDLWEELQEWHAENCGQADDGTFMGLPCACHRILAAKWDEITSADDWSDDEAQS